MSDNLERQYAVVMQSLPGDGKGESVDGSSVFGQVRVPIEQHDGQTKYPLAAEPPLTNVAPVTGDPNYYRNLNAPPDSQGSETGSVVFVIILALIVGALFVFLALTHREKTTVAPKKDAEGPS